MAVFLHAWPLSFNDAPVSLYLSVQNNLFGHLFNKISEFILCFCTLGRGIGLTLEKKVGLEQKRKKEDDIKVAFPQINQNAQL